MGTKHHVNTQELGECFFAWLHMLIDSENVGIKFFRRVETEEFPFPFKADAKFENVDGEQGSKSGTLQNTNKSIAKCVKDKEIDIPELIEETLEFFLQTNKKLPLFFKKKIEDFITDEGDKVALIHIRYRGQNKDEDFRNLTNEEFNLIISSLEGQNFNKFILIGDLAECSYIKHLEATKFCILDYIKPIMNSNDQCKEALKAWGIKDAWFLAKQILLIHLIHKQFEQVKLLIGRKSGAGLDMHAYAGMPTIFIDDDKYNERYAIPDKKGLWSEPHLSNLVPVFCPKNDGIPVNTSIATAAVSKSKGKTVARRNNLNSISSNQSSSSSAPSFFSHSAASSSAPQPSESRKRKRDSDDEIDRLSKRTYLAEGIKIAVNDLFPSLEPSLELSDRGFTR